nr:hypothetical protein [Tanacetum cinerariifolium]
TLGTHDGEARSSRSKRPRQHEIVEETLGTHDEEARSSRSKRPRQHEIVEEVFLSQVHHEFLLWEGCSRDAKPRKCKVLTEDVPDVPRVGIPRPPRASMQDLYDRMGRMEIFLEAIEHMEYRQSYH